MVAVSEDKKAISVSLDAEHVDWMDSENINRSGLLNDLVDQYRSGGDSVDTAVKRMRLSQIEQQIESNERENEQLREEMERIETHVDSAQQRYHAELDDVLSTMEDGAGIHAGMPRVKSLASDFYGDAARAPDVIDDLRERADDYDIDDSQWNEP